MGYVEHGIETTAPGKDNRSFRTTGLLTFAEQTCFILTGTGAAWVAAVQETTPTLAPWPGSPSPEIPHWDVDQRNCAWLASSSKNSRCPPPTRS